MSISPILWRNWRRRLVPSALSDYLDRHPESLLYRQGWTPDLEQGNERSTIDGGRGAG